MTRSHPRFSSSLMAKAALVLGRWSAEPDTEECSACSAPQRDQLWALMDHEAEGHPSAVAECPACQHASTPTREDTT